MAMVIGTNKQSYIGLCLAEAREQEEKERVCLKQMACSSMLR